MISQSQSATLTLWAFYSRVPESHATPGIRASNFLNPTRPESYASLRLFYNYGEMVSNLSTVHSPGELS